MLSHYIMKKNPEHLTMATRMNVQMLFFIIVDKRECMTQGEMSEGSVSPYAV